MLSKENFDRIASDTNGNPRFVLHYTNIDNNYEKALEIAGKHETVRKYNTKNYSWGIIFQTYSLDSVVKALNNELYPKTKTPKKLQRKALAVLEKMRNIRKCGGYTDLQFFTLPESKQYLLREAIEKMEQFIKSL